MAYDAFISYSHAADSQLAPKLQDSLQRLAKPWWRRRSLRVFRDTTGLSANPGLWSSIEAAMNDSKWFVFLASPEAAASPWVQREVTAWVEANGTDRLLPVLTDGSWVWDDTTNDFDWAASTAVPLVLAGVFSEEPRHVDLSWARSEEQLDLRNGRFRDQVAEIAAPMHGLAKDDLEGVDVREHRRTLRWAWGAAAALIMLVLASGTAGAMAVRNSNQAEEARAEAVANADEAATQRTAAQEKEAEAQESADRATASDQKAQDRAAEAEAARQDAEASADAATASEQTAKDEADKAEQARSAATASERTALDEAGKAERSRAAAAASEQTAQGQARRADAEANSARLSAEQATASQRQTAQALASERQALAAEETAGREAVARRDEARVAQAQAERATDLAQRASTQEVQARQEATVARQVAETEGLAAASKAQSGQDGSLSLLLAVESLGRGQASAPAAQRAGFFAATEQEAGSAVGRRALFEAVTAAQGGVDAYRVDRYLPFPPEVVDPPSFIWKPVVSPDGRYLAAAELADIYRNVAASAPSRIFVWDLNSPTPSVKVLLGHAEQVGALAFAGNGRTLVSQDVPYLLQSAPTTRIWDTVTGDQLLARSATAFISPTGDHVALQLLPRSLKLVQFVDGRTGELAGRAQSGFLSLDPVGTGRGTLSTPYLEQPFSPDGRWALGESDGLAVVWDLESPMLRPFPLAGPDTFFSYAPRVSPDGTTAVAVENDSNLAFFNLDSEEFNKSNSVTESFVVNAVWSPDGSRLATIDIDGRVSSVDPAAPGSAPKDERIEWAADAPLGELAFSPDGRFLVVTDSTFDEQTGFNQYRSTVFGASTGVSYGRFEGRLIATSKDREPDLFFERQDGTLRVVDSSTNRTSLAESASDALTGITVSDSGRWLSASNATSVRVWDLNSGAGPVRASLANSADFSTDFRGIIPGVDSRGEFSGVLRTAPIGLAFDGDDRLIGIGVGVVPTVWDLTKVGAGNLIGVTTKDSTMLDDGVTSFEDLADGRTIRLRNVETNASRPGPTLADGETVDYLFAGAQGTPLVANLTNGTAVVARPDASVIGRTTGLVLSATLDGSRLVVRGVGRSVDVVETADLSLAGTVDLAALPDDILITGSAAFALSPDGTLLAVTNATGTTVVWEVATGEVVTTIEGRPADRTSFPVPGLSFSPDGTRLVVRSPSNDVRMYQVGAGPDWRLLATQRLPIKFAGRVVFSPDGSLIAIDGLSLLDGDTLAPIARLFNSPGTSLKFSADGRTLVSVTGGKPGDTREIRPVYRWTVGADELTTEACRMAGRQMTPDEWNRYMGRTGIPYRATCRE